MKSCKIFIIALLAFATVCLFDSDLYGRGGSFRSSSRSSSFSSPSRSSSTTRSSWESSRRSSPSRTSTWGGSSRKSTPASNSSNWGSSSRSLSNSPSFSTKSRSSLKPVRSTADQKLYDKAKTSGTAFSSKSSAVSSFKSKYGNQYKSTYSSKPSSRPEHIPQTTSSGGKTYNVTYNSQYGGYGYMGPSGSWIMYDAMADVAMMSMLMNRHNYYYDRPGAVTYVDSGGGGALVWLGAIFVLILIGGAIYVAANS